LLSVSDATKSLSRCAADPKVSETLPWPLLASRSTSPNTREETPRACGFADSDEARGRSAVGAFGGER
jgi:hypothetical protein